MKKILFKLLFGLMLIALFPVQVAQACSAFIVGKDLTTDGSMLYGRTEDYPYAPDGGRHNQNFVVVPAKDYKEGDKIEDESNGFAYPHLTHEMKYRPMMLRVVMVATETSELMVLMKWACR